MGVSGELSEGDVRRLSEHLEGWCGEHLGFSLSLLEVLRPLPGNSGAYASAVREYGLVIQHPCEVGVEEARAGAAQWASLLTDELLPGGQSRLVLLRTAFERLAERDRLERLEHARAFAQRWLDRIDAVHGLCVTVAEGENPLFEGMVCLEIVEAVGEDEVELFLSRGEVAWMLQKLYGQCHPERVLGVRFCVDVWEAQPLRPARYLRGFTHVSSVDDGDGLEGEAPLEEEEDDFQHAFEFACQWLECIGCEHNLYISGTTYYTNTVVVIRDDVSTDFHLDEENVAAVIEQRYRERHPQRPHTFFGEYCK